MFELNENSNIRNINITETGEGADVELALSDVPDDDDAQEYLSFSVHVRYEKDKAIDLDSIKKESLRLAKKAIAHEIGLIEDAQGKRY
jgi:hypothetical protein